MGWLTGLQKIVTGPMWRLLAFGEFRLKEFDRDRDGAGVDEIQEGNGRSVNAAH